MLGPDAGLKGCAFAHRQAPAATLDPVARPQQLADIRAALNVSATAGVSFLLCTPGDISILRRHRRRALIIPDGQTNQRASDTGNQFGRREWLGQNFYDAKPFGNYERMGPVEATAS